MPKKNLLASAALTAFILVIATGVASAYQRVNATIEAVKVQSSAEVSANAARDMQTTGTDAGVSADAANPAVQQVQATLTHQEAALVAANYLGQTDLYSVENVTWEGVDAYEVVFSTGDSVFVSMTGEVLSTKAPEPVVVIETVTSPNSTSSGTSTGMSSARSSSNSRDDDHGDDHDDD